jgi:hypothetical protein
MAKTLSIYEARDIIRDDQRQFDDTVAYHKTKAEIVLSKKPSNADDRENTPNSAMLDRR